MNKINELTSFELIPYIGTDLVSFDLNSKDVERSLGRSESTATNNKGQLVEFRSYMNVAYSAGEYSGVDHIGFGRQMKNVHLLGLKIFEERPLDVLRELSVNDPHPMEYMGFIFFFKLGLSLTGFHDADTAQRAASVFPRDRWASRIHKMKPMNF